MCCESFWSPFAGADSFGWRRRGDAVDDLFCRRVLTPHIVYPFFIDFNKIEAGVYVPTSLCVHVLKAVFIATSRLRA